MSIKEVEILKRALARERAARKQAEGILEKKSEELFFLNQKINDSKNKVEALLKVKNSELKGFFENIVDPYIMMDLYGNAIKMNKAAEDLVGYNLSERPLNLMKLTVSKELNLITTFFEKLSETGKISDLRITIKTSYGTKRLVHLNASIIYDEHNKPIAAQGIFRDITKQNKIQKKLTESENRMATLLLSLDSSVVLENEKGKIVLTNQNFCDLLEVKQEPMSLIGKSFKKILNESSFLTKAPKELKNKVDQMLRDKLPVVIESIELTDGVVLKIEFNPIFKKGIYKGHLWNFKDITLRKKYQKSLEAEKQKYSNIIANMNLGLIELDKKGRVVFTNQSFESILGYEKEELLGKSTIDLFLNEKNKKGFLDLVKKREQGISDSYEIKVKNKQGDYKYLLVSGAPNYNLNGEFVGTIGINYDITNLKILENQKEELLKELEKSNESLQEYAHVVSHDLKSPLRSIDALVAWIKEDNTGKLDDVTLENFQMIESTLEKMENLISDVLAYSSVGANFEFNKTVDSQKLVDELWKVMYVPDNINLTFNSELPIIQGDKLKLQQLFQNLLSNAIKFCDKEKGKIVVGCKQVNHYYEFYISDNGIGIEKNYFEKIFEIFHSLNKRKDSSGIGLSIVKKIVEMHEGKVWLESEVGKGTTFYFTIKNKP